jgi:methyl-accepting chemotaxis protein
MQPTPPPFSFDRPRVIGMTLIATGVLGLLISLTGLVFIGTATDDGLDVAAAALSDTERTLSSLSVTIADATVAISETQPSLAALQRLTGEQLPQTIGETRQALDSAGETARVVDGVLSALSFLGVNYNPEVPLDVALARVSESLAEVPNDLVEVSRGVERASANLDDLVADLGEVADGLDAIARSVDEASGVVEQYKTVVGDLRGEVAAVQEAAPGWITAVQWGLFLLLAWLALAQIGLLTQGWEILERR